MNKLYHTKFNIKIRGSFEFDDTDTPEWFDLEAEDAVEM